MPDPSALFKAECEGGEHLLGMSVAFLPFRSFSVQVQAGEDEDINELVLS